MLRGPGGAAFAEGLRSMNDISVASIAPERWLVRTPDHRTLCDALAVVPRPPERLRVEVDPADA